jgi:DNA-binding NarL/FixJ family response regulator
MLWAARAQDELARLGGRSPAGAEFTESERRVAELVAAALSNKEVAVRLVVTSRTVEAHLSRIYAKRGIRSRAELAARWPESSSASRVEAPTAKSAARTTARSS